MRRRQLVTMLTTGAIGAAAGCGYAYGGGDVRDAGSVGTGGFGETRYVLGDERIVVARSGRHFWHGDEETTFDDGTSLTVADRAGESRWRYSHRARSVAVAGSGPVYLLDDEHRVVAVVEVPPDGDSPAERRRPYDGEEVWRASVDGSRAPLAAGHGGAYVAVGDGVAAVRDGEPTWTADVAASVESLHVTEGSVLVGTSDAVVALTPDGRERWRRETDDVARLAVAAGRVAIRDGSRLLVGDLETGERRWNATVGPPGGQPTMTAARVYVPAGSSVIAFHVERGDRRWGVSGGGRLEPPVIPAPEGVYVVRRDCQALGLAADGARWTRELSVGSCTVVGGWLDGESVAFLFDSGDLRWLQRTDQHPGLLQR